MAGKINPWRCLHREERSPRIGVGGREGVVLGAERPLCRWSFETTSQGRMGGGFLMERENQGEGIPDTESTLGKGAEVGPSCGPGRRGTGAEGDL